MLGMISSSASLRLIGPRLAFGNQNFPGDFIGLAGIDQTFRNLSGSSHCYASAVPNDETLQ